jgi:hypothetical protein
LIVIAIRSYRRRDYYPLLLTTAVCCFIMGDTLLCTTISGVHDRYQARVMWLVVMAALLGVFRTSSRAMRLAFFADRLARDESLTSARSN